MLETRSEGICLSVNENAHCNGFDEQTIGHHYRFPPESLDLVDFT